MNVLIAIVALQIVILAAVAFLFIKLPVGPADSKLTEVPGQLTRLDARSESLDLALRDS